MMTLIFDLLIGMLFISGISMTAVGLYARRFTGRVPAATPFILLMFCAAAWAILYALDLLAPTLPSRIAFHNLRFLFLPFFSVLELWLVIAYVKRTEWLRRDWAALILIIPVISAILAITSPYHTLFRYNFSISLAGPVPVLQYTESAFYEAYFLYSFLLLILAIALLITESRRRGTLWEIPTFLLLTALAFPTALNYYSQIYEVPLPGINLTPAVLWIAAILYAIALFRYRFLDIVPIARSRLIEIMATPVLVLDTDERVIDLNPAANALFSTSFPSAVGNKIADIVPDWPDFLSLCRRDGPHQEDLIREWKGGITHYTGSAEPLLTQGGDTEGRIIFLQDITNRKKAENALREKSRDLEERVKELRCLYEIARLIETFTGQDALFQAIADVIPSGWQYPEFTCARIVVDKREFRSGKYQEGSHRQVAEITVHGQYTGNIVVFFQGETEKDPFIPEERDLLYAIAERLSRVLERIQAETALHESEEKYRSIIDEMQDIFYRTDPAGTITMLSPSAGKLAGYDSIDQLIGKDVTTIYADPADREKLLAALSETGSVDAFPLTLKVSDGTMRYVTTSSHFFHDSHGTVQGVEGVIHDITDQRKAEDSLRMANKKLHLLSSITRHDIRNQLMALMAFLELSVESVNNPAELADFLTKNQKIAETIARQISFTKDYEDLGVKAPSWHEVSAAMGKAASELPVKNILIEVETNGLLIFADPLVEKVFYNLIDNSLRYGGEQRTKIRISTRPSGSSTVLVFEDNGSGIPDRDKQVIFDRGFGKNTGLGLYLSREILAITGIAITETGVFGTGARFEMMIPEGGFRFKTPDA